MSKNSTEKIFFEKNGFIKLNIKIKSKNFDKLCDEIIEETNEFYLKNFDKIKKLGGYLTGNLELLPSKKLIHIWKILCNRSFKKTFKDIFGKKISDFDVKFSGNIVLPKKGYQHFHTDGPLRSKKIILNVAVHDIDTSNAPTEILINTHNRKMKYWEFYFLEFFKKKKRKLLKMQKGEVVIRNHSIWHRGTRNNSKNLRILLLFQLTEKKLHNKFTQIINKDLMIGENQFKSSFKQNLKESISIYLAPLYIFYRIITSFFKK